MEIKVIEENWISNENKAKPQANWHFEFYSLQKNWDHTQTSIKKENVQKENKANKVKHNETLCKCMLNVFLIIIYMKVEI